MTDEAKIVHQVCEALGIEKVAPQVYEDGLRPAVQETGQALAVLAKTVRVAISPLEALGWSYDLAKGWLGPAVLTRLARKGVKDPCQPPMAVAVPLVQAAPAASEEPSLQRMYASLLASAMDPKTTENVHPSFVHTIQQLSPDEAVILRHVQESGECCLASCSTPLEGLTAHGKGIVSQFTELCESAGVARPSEAETYLDNLVRLRILDYLKDTSGYGAHLLGDFEVKNVYEEVVEVTRYGRLFMEACCDAAQPVD